MPSFKAKCQLNDSTIVRLVIHEDTAEKAISKLLDTYKPIEKVLELEEKTKARTGTGAIYKATALPYGQKMGFRGKKFWG